MCLRMILICGLSAFSCDLQAQAVSPNVFSAAGNASQQLSYTIGEPLTFTLSTSSYQLTQGFHQTFLEVVSVQETDAEFQFEVYPNPVRNELHFSFPSVFDKLDVQIFDAQGKRVWEQQINHGESISMSSYSRGLYTVVLYHSKLTAPQHFSIIRS